MHQRVKVLLGCAVFSLACQSYAAPVRCFQFFSHDESLGAEPQLPERSQKALDEALNRLEPSILATTWESGIRDLLKRHPALTFQQIERRLRELRSKAYLLAKPMSLLAEEHIVDPEFSIADYTSKSPQGDEDQPFYIFYSLQGEQEAEYYLGEWGISYEENFQNLAGTGFNPEVK